MDDATQKKSQMMHIRLPLALHQQMKARAEADGMTLQDLAVLAITQSLKGTIEPTSGLTQLYQNHYSSALHAKFHQILSQASDIALLGTHLLDFLSDDGWGTGALMAFLEDNRGRARIVIEEKDSPFAIWRISSRSRIAPDKTDEIAQTATYLRGRQAEIHLQDLLHSFPGKVEGRKNGGYPNCRWMCLADGQLIIQPHCPKAKSMSRTNGNTLPVFGFASHSAMAKRFSEYFEKTWKEGGE